MKKVMALVFFLAAASILGAQENFPAANMNRGAVYMLGSEDELLIPVNIWGFISRPGQYWVPNNTDLMSLISFAGGPTESGKISNIRIVPSEPKTKPYNVNIKKYLDTGDSRLVPMLKPGDTVVVKGSTFHWISRFFEFVSRLAVLAQIAYFVALANEYFSR